MKTRRIALLWGRSGYAGSHTIPAAWAGDSSSDKATHSAILQAGLGMAMSGVSFWGYDLGGFYHTGYTGNEERPDAEDYLSSVQMGLWMPLSRAHGKTPREPWQYGDLALERVKKWINFRHRLAPYLYHTACQSHLFRHSDASSGGNGISKGSDGEDAESVVYAGRFLIDLARL